MGCRGGASPKWGGTSFNLRSPVEDKSRNGKWVMRQWEILFRSFRRIFILKPNPMKNRLHGLWYDKEL